MFDLSRSIDLHRRSMARSREEAVAGRTSGLIRIGEDVDLAREALRRAAAADGAHRRLRAPRWFRGELVRGAFATIVHGHHFDPVDGGTEMRDVFRFRTLGGPLGRMIERLALGRYMTRLLAHPNAVIKAAAEGDTQRKLLEGK